MNKNKMSVTPLKNSCFANKPFRSPITNNTEKLNSSGCKRHIADQPKPIIRLKTESKADTEQVCIQSEAKLTYSTLNAVKRRIREKRQNVACLQTRLAYNKKHKKEDLEPLIGKWRDACQEALDRFLNDARDRQDPTLSMTQILSQLGIPQSLVYKTDTERIEDVEL